MTDTPPTRITEDDPYIRGGGVFNCGPAALCAVTDKAPVEIMDHLKGFAKKHYTNPKMMLDALNSLNIEHEIIYQCHGTRTAPNLRYPKFGLARIQWGGPWTDVGQPAGKRYRHSHWIAIDGDMTFDINALGVGGWLTRGIWESKLVPWLLQQCEPESDGTWWPTHCIEIPRPQPA